MLNRPHTEFLQSQMLPWRRIPPGAARPDAEYKHLSRDADNGACLIRYPAGGRHVNIWTADEAPFDFHRPYAPVLPAALAHLRDVPWQPARGY